MYELVDKEGTVAAMRDGVPFRYSSKALAWLAKPYLERLRGVALRPREVAA